MKLIELFLGVRPGALAREERQPTGARRAVIALGGGGARGLAHLGVMQSLCELGVHTERIVGTSMGSLIGAMIAADPDIHRVQSRAIGLLRSPVFQHRQQLLCGAARPSEVDNAGGVLSWYPRLRKYLQAHRRLSRAVIRPSLITEEPLRDSINHLLPDIDLRELPTPLSIVAVDLLTGQRVVLEKGPLRRAVRASAAIPGIFPPIIWDNMLLADIGVIESVPTLVARSYASDLTIAVDVGQDHHKIRECKSAMEVMMRVDEICERLVRGQLLRAADLIIRPEVGNVAWFDFSDPERLIRQGRIAGHKAMQSLAELQVA
jgi:NTE family protein